MVCSGASCGVGVQLWSSGSGKQLSEADALGCAGPAPCLLRQATSARGAQVFIPALFGHADRDTFVGLHHSQRLFAAYAGDKNLVTFGGDHNSHRAPFFYSSAVIFLHSALQCRNPLPRGEPLVDPVAHLHTCAPGPVSGHIGGFEQMDTREGLIGLHTNFLHSRLCMTPCMADLGCGGTVSFMPLKTDCGIGEISSFIGYSAYS